LNASSDPWIQSTIDSVLIHQSAFFDTKVEEWEEELKTCPHTENLD